MQGVTPDATVEQIVARLDRDELARQLSAAAGSIASCHTLLSAYARLFERLEREAKDLESFGPVLAPGLFLQMQREPWRADVREAFAAALAFVRAMDAIRDKAARRAKCAS